MDFPVQVVQTVLLTGQLADEKPVSLLIIASPESGKTTAARKASISVSSDSRGDELAVPLTDTTGKGLLKVIREHPRATHIIFNDLAITAGHKSHVTKYLFSVISAMTEEGISRIADPEGVHPYSKEEGIKGVIGCITPRLVGDQRFIWNITGLTTRMLPFFYNQGFEIQLKVRRYHAGLLDQPDQLPENSSLVIPKAKMHVSVRKNYKEEILELAHRVAQKLSREGVSKKNPDYEELGYRRIIQFVSLAKANSLLTHSDDDDEPRVHRINVEFLRKLSRFVSFREPETLEESSSSTDGSE
jgi:hypothetical protein